MAWLAPTGPLLRGLHAPDPVWDFIGMAPLNRKSAKNKSHETTPMRSILLPLNSADYLSEGPIPRRLLPSSADYASDQRKINEPIFELKFYL